ncbi:hypothetical protein MMC28_009678 [Mycoblastus sanguinarius]|nr:hypothetical protein [Mycoblastus sanguinarius]
MATIFQDAASSLQDLRSPLTRPSSNMHRTRMPLSQARGIKFGSAHQDDTMVSARVMSHSKMSLHQGSSLEAALSLQQFHHQLTRTGPQSSSRTPKTKADRIIYQSFSDHPRRSPTPQRHISTTPIFPANDAIHAMRVEDAARESISCDFAMPTAETHNLPRTPEGVNYPSLEHWKLPQPTSIISSFGSDDRHSSHGVRLIMPFSHSDAEEAQRANIDSWLNGVMEAKEDESSLVSQLLDADVNDEAMDNIPLSPTAIANETAIHKSCMISPPRPYGDLVSTTRSSRDKENVRPTKLTPPSIRPLKQPLYSDTPSRFRNPTIQPTAIEKAEDHSLLASRFKHTLTPQGHLNLPPKRKKARVNNDLAKGSKPIQHFASKDFTVHDDQLADALSQLSPDVERHRKGRGPKRERCLNYWDEDILQPGSLYLPMEADSGDVDASKRTQALGESKQSNEMTMSTSLVDEVGGAPFKFPV